MGLTRILGTPQARATFGYIDLANPPAKIKESQKKSIDFLYNQINLDPRFPFPDVEDSKRYILKVAQGFLIPRAWIMAHTGNVQHKQGFKPVILETGTRCDQPHPPSPSEAGGLLWEHVDRNQVQVCLDGQRFYVVSAVGDFYAGEGVAIPMFEKLPGWDTLQGGSSANSEVYISQEDVVRRLAYFSFFSFSAFLPQPLRCPSRLAPSSSPFTSLLSLLAIPLGSLYLDDLFPLS